MEISTGTFDSVILAGDIGGTNTNLALVGRRGKLLKMLAKRRYGTWDETSLIQPVARFLDSMSAEFPGLRPDACCISAAGPVTDNHIALTNAPWSIDGDEMGATFGLPVLLVNDFIAVSYGILLLDPDNPEQITRLRHTDGSDPAPRAGVKVIAGAGTGLGVGFIVPEGDSWHAYASEGGHAALPWYDQETLEFCRWLESGFGFIPGAEAGVSGQGIANLFRFYTERDTGIGTGAAASDDRGEMPDPAWIAKAAATDPLCRRVMSTFVRLYARVCSDLCATFLPAGGIYLAGGIAAKNLPVFSGGYSFMTSFERNYKPHIRGVLARTPVMIVRDYSVSLYGAANAYSILS